MPGHPIQPIHLTVDGLDIHALSAGSGERCLLALHGGGSDSASLSWGDLVEPLAASGIRVIAPDLPGYGESARPDVNYTTAYYLEFIEHLVAALSIPRFSLLGLSMGGALALGTALRHPDWVDKLVLAGSYGLQREVAYHKASWLMVQMPGLMESTWALVRTGRGMARWSASQIFHNPRTIPESLVDELYAEALKPHAGRAFTRYQRDDVLWNGLRTVYIDRLGELALPTLLVHGRGDAAVPLRWVEDAHRRILGSQLRVIDGAGHWVQREQPEAFRQAVVHFLNS